MYIKHTQRQPQDSKARGSWQWDLHPDSEEAAGSPFPPVLPNPGHILTSWGQPPPLKRGRLEGQSCQGLGSLETAAGSHSDLGNPLRPEGPQSGVQQKGRPAGRTGRAAFIVRVPPRPCVHAGVGPSRRSSRAGLHWPLGLLGPMWNFTTVERFHFFSNVVHAHVCRCRSADGATLPINQPIISQ